MATRNHRIAGFTALLLVLALGIGAWLFTRGSGLPDLLQSASPPYRLNEYSLVFERTPCLGSCPAFTLTIAEDRSTQLEVVGVSSLPGDRHARFPTYRFRGRATPAQMQALVSTIEQGELWRLDSAYEAQASDQASANISVRTPARSWSVRVSGVPCKSAATSAWHDDEETGPVPDVFCRLTDQLDVLACQAFLHGSQPALDPGSEILFAPRC